MKVKDINKQKRWVFYCHEDAKNWTKHPWFKNIKRGQFITFKYDRYGEATKQIGINNIEEAEVYDDPDMLWDVYDDFAMCDCFWAVPLRTSKAPDTALWLISGDITKSKKDVIVEIDFTLFYKNKDKKKAG